MRNFAGPIVAALACMLGIGGMASAAQAAQGPAAQRLGPKVDHHQHLLSPGLAEILTKADGLDLSVRVPSKIRSLLQRRTAAWNDAKALGLIYAEQAVLTEREVVTGRAAVAEFVATRFRAAYKIEPRSFADNGGSSQLAVLFTRGDGAERVIIGDGLLSFSKDKSGNLTIAGEAVRFPGPGDYRPTGADDLVKALDEAAIDRAVVLSIAYIFQSPLLPKLPNAAARLRAENDWTAVEVAKNPSRLIGFCSVNPLTDTALPEIDRCARELKLKGLKLHLGNSGVDVKNAAQLARVQQVFQAANRWKLPVVAHLWTGPDFGASEAEIFLAKLLPQAPDVTVQIAHMAGGGPGWTDPALEVFAKAIEVGDTRTRQLYFDIATVADLQTHEQLALLAKRIRQIGVDRILYGSDAGWGGRDSADKEWGNFRGMVPLTDAEFAVIRDNVAPYLR